MAGYFPSISAGWVIAEEEFMRDNSFVDFLKLRASWGQNGNADINPFQYRLVAFDPVNNYRFGNDRNRCNRWIPGNTTLIWMCHGKHLNN